MLPRKTPGVYIQQEGGRWPANVVHDGSDEVVGAFPSAGGQQGRAKIGGDKKGSIYGDFGANKTTNPEPRGDSGSAARFFYTAKADDDDRIGSKHPTVKPVDLMQWLVRLVTPRGGLILDPFAGTGTTGEAAWREGFRAILIEREEEYQADIARRMALCLAGPEERRRESIKAKMKDKPQMLAPNDLFAP
ncbi:MAG: site-specific DNA-methyltransferase [Pseudolabrys sp.]